MADTPLDFPGLVLWLDADDPATITDSGGTVTLWTDKSPAGLDFTITSGAGPPRTGPTTGIGTINSRNVLTFNGTSDTMAASSSILVGDLYIVATFFAGPITINGLFSKNVGDTENIRLISGQLVFATQGGGDYIDENVGGELFINAIETASISFDVPFILDADVGPIIPTFIPQLSQSQFTNRWWRGVIGEVVIYDRILSNNERLDITHYLSNKWAIPIGGLITSPPGRIGLDPVVSAGGDLVYVATAGDLTTAGENRIGVTDTSVVRTITISTADITNAAFIGRVIIINDESGGAGTNNIIIDTEGGETIDGVASLSITVDYGDVSIYSDGTNLFTV